VKEPYGEIHRLIRKYIWTTKRHRNIIERRLAATGVYRSQHQILMFLADNPDVSQRELADNQKVSTATMAVSLKKLEKGGYICREVDEKDNRYNQIRITEKGQKVVEESRKIFQEVENAMLAGFSQEERRMMEAFLDRMYENLGSYARDVCRRDPCCQESEAAGKGETVQESETADHPDKMI